MDSNAILMAMIRAKGYIEFDPCRCEKQPYWDEQCQHEMVPCQRCRVIADLDEAIGQMTMEVKSGDE